MNEFKNMKLKMKKKSFTDVAYEKIRELILSEEIEPGEVVSENQLAEYLNMSRTPVREAIRRLEADGILVSRQGYGTVLKMLTLKDIEDIFEVREAMELIAAETAIHNITKEEIQELKEKLMNLLERFHRGEIIEKREFTKIDGEIHDLIVRRSDNEYVKVLMERIYFNVDRYRCISYKVSLDLEESTGQHLDLLQCMEERDIEKFTKHLKKHIQWSLDIIRDHVRL